MSSFFSRSRRLAGRIPGWLLSLAIFAVVIGVIGGLWISTWYVHGSKLQIELPSSQGQVTISGAFYLVDEVISLPSFGIHYPIQIAIPYEKTLTCGQKCDILDMPHGKYKISARSMPDFRDWSGDIVIESDTVGIFLLPAEAFVPRVAFEFPGDIRLIHENDKANISELFVSPKKKIYNPFERLSFFETEGGYVVYAHTTKTSYNILEAPDDVEMIKKLGSNFLLIAQDGLYLYSTKDSNLSKRENLMDQSEQYELSSDGTITKEGSVLFTDTRIEGIFTTEKDDLILKYKDGYYRYGN